MAIKVVEKTRGDKISYRVTSKGIIYFGDDDLSIKLRNYERDDDVNIDICMNAYQMLVMGQGVKYVAQIHIPPREYVEKKIENSDTTVENDFYGGMRNSIVREPVPFNVDRCTLYLWGLEDTEEIPTFSGDINMAEETSPDKAVMEE